MHAVEDSSLLLGTKLRETLRFAHGSISTLHDPERSRMDQCDRLEIVVKADFNHLARIHWFAKNP